MLFAPFRKLASYVFHFFFVSLLVRLFFCASPLSKINDNRRCFYLCRKKHMKHKNRCTAYFNLVLVQFHRIGLYKINVYVTFHFFFCLKPSHANENTRHRMRLESTEIGFFSFSFLFSLSLPVCLRRHVILIPDDKLNIRN